MTEPHYDETQKEAEKRVEQDNEEQLKAIEKERKLVMAYREVQATEAGKTMMADLEQFAGFGFPSYRIGTGRDGVYDSVFFDGRKDIVKYMYARAAQKLPIVEDKPKTADES
jgi:hypothetical protein